MCVDPLDVLCRCYLFKVQLANEGNNGVQGGDMNLLPDQGWGAIA